MMLDTQMRLDTELKAMVPKELKEKALEALGGIPLNDAITFYLKKIVEAGGIPFDLDEESIDTSNVPFVRMDENGYFIFPEDWWDDDDDDDDYWPKEEDQPRFNDETEAAIREARDIASGKIEAPTYETAEELIAAALESDD